MIKSASGPQQELLQLHVMPTVAARGRHMRATGFDLVFLSRGGAQTHEPAQSQLEGGLNSKCLS